MANIGPIDDAEQMRTGKQFIDELFDEEEEEMLQTNREIENNIEQSLSQSSDNNNYKNDRVLTEGNEGGLLLPEETSQFQAENRDILLNLSKYTLRKIVMLICDETGFLLEQKLVHLLSPLEKNEKSMVKLDSIFKALGVETENDVKLLAQYFVNHRNYKDLVKNRAFVQRRRSSGGEEGAEDIQRIVPLDSVELIHPNEVITALKTFATLNKKGDR